MWFRLIVSFSQIRPAGIWQSDIRILYDIGSWTNMYVWEPLIVLYKYISFFMFWTKVDENQIEYWLLFYKLLKFTFQDCLKQQRILTTFICMLREPISSTIPFHIPHKPDALNIYLHSYSEYLPCFILLTYYFSQESYGSSPSRCLGKSLKTNWVLQMPQVQLNCQT